MAKMKDLVMDILEDFENRIPVSVIARKYDMSVSEVERLIDEWADMEFHMV